MCYIPTEENLKQSNTSTMDWMPETSVSTKSDKSTAESRESVYDHHLEDIKVYKRNIEEIDNGLCQLNKTLQYMEQDLKVFVCKASTH